MRFQVEHHFPAAPDRVLDVLVDPGFHLELDLPDLARPTIVDHLDDGDEAVLRFRYEFIGQLDAVAQRLVAGRRLTWLQELRVRRGERRAALTFGAEGHAERLHGTADFTFVADGETTVRRADGELVVAVPLVSRMAERRIVPGVLRRLDIEADHLAQRLR